ncbi:MAG: hypothetical protein ABJQ29_17275 [Luteolibacter sp.]
MKPHKLIGSVSLFLLAGIVHAETEASAIPVSDGLVLDLDAEKGVTLEDGDRVVAWKNQVADFPAQDFVSNDKGRKEAGSGRPLLKTDVAALGGKPTLVFNEDELINFDEDAFDGLTQGSGYTWLFVLAPHEQDGKLEDVNAFFGNLTNGSPYAGLWGGFEDDNDMWMGTRTGIMPKGEKFSRWNIHNPKVMGPKLEVGKYYVVAGRMGAGKKSARIESFVNGTEPFASVECKVAPKSNPSKMAIGTERDAVQHPGKESFDGEIARGLIFERPLTDEELGKVMEYLKEEYRIK